MRIFAAILAVALLAGATRAGDLPGARPVLRIEPGMHTAPIKSVGVDAACTLMVTGSDDKTARLWALPQEEGGSPELLRTLRVPIGEGDDGKVYAVALSPDGKWVAAGGWDARYSVDKTMSAYIFEAATGRLVTRLGTSWHDDQSSRLFGPTAAASPRHLVPAKACGCGRRWAGCFSLRTRIMAARTAMVPFSMAGTSFIQWPTMGRSAATVRMEGSKRRRQRMAVRSHSASRCIPKRASSSSALPIPLRLRFTTRAR